MLQAETLRGIVEEFVLREGTDYGYGQSAGSEGPRSASLETKVSQVMRQLERGDVLVVFDQATESCDLVTRGSKAHQAAALAPIADSRVVTNEE